MLIWNPQNKGHDIRIKGEIVHQMKEADFTAAVGTIPQKEAIVAGDINTKFAAANNKMKTAVHIERYLPPIKYAMWCGPVSYVLPNDWWVTEKEDG